MHHKCFKNLIHRSVSVQIRKYIYLYMYNKQNLLNACKSNILRHLIGIIVQDIYQIDFGISKKVSRNLKTRISI